MSSRIVSSRADRLNLMKSLGKSVESVNESESVGENLYRPKSQEYTSNTSDAEKPCSNQSSRLSVGVGLMSSGSTAGLQRLAQEIHDEFLICKICLDAYKSPKCLSCLHTFCEQCIENHIVSEATYKKYSDYREFTCPLCRKRTQLPVGGVKKLPDNILVSSLGETLQRQKNVETPICDICKMIAKRTREATSKCLECNKLLCKSCVELHKFTKVTREHSMFDVDIEKDVLCKEHLDEVVRFYCEPCQTCVCVLCTFNEHRDHEVSNFSEAVAKYKSDIEEMLSGCKDRIQTYEVYLEQVSKTERQIKEAEDKIHDLAIDFIAEVRQKEKQLIEEIHNLYGAQTMDIIERKTEMCNSLTTLQNTCALTEVILQGKDIELLLLKKDVQEKLYILNKATDQDLPRTLTKEIRFLPGQIDLGCIQDMDRPLSTRMKNLNMSSMSQSSLENYYTEVDAENAQTQTEYLENEFSMSSTSKTTDQESQYDFSHQYVSRDTNTDVVELTEKGINTRSRGLMRAHTESVNSEDVSDGNAEARRRRQQRLRERNLVNESSSLETASYDNNQSSSNNDNESTAFRGRYNYRRRYHGGGYDGEHSNGTEESYGY